MGRVQRRRLPVGHVHHRHRTRRLGRVRHGARVRMVGRQRLLAQDVLARAEQRDARVLVHGIGRYHRGAVELAPLQRVVDRAEALADLVALAELREIVLLDVDRADHLDAAGLVVLGVEVRHVARADDQDAHRRAHLKPASPLACSFGPRSSIFSSARSIGKLGASVTFSMRGCGLQAQRTALRRTCWMVASW